MNTMPIHNFYTEEQISLVAWEVEEGDHVFDIDNTNFVQIDTSDDDGVFDTRAVWDAYVKELSENNVPDGVIAYWKKEFLRDEYIFARQVGTDAYMEVNKEDLEFDFNFYHSHGLKGKEVIEIYFKTKIKCK